VKTGGRFLGDNEAARQLCTVEETGLEEKENQKLIVTLDNAKDMVLGRSRISASRG